MSAGSIVALIITGIVIMVVVAFIAQSIENARQERQRRVRLLLDNARQMWEALEVIPPIYLIPELRQFLIAELKRSYRQVLTLEPRHPQAAGQLKNIDELAKQPYERQVDTLKPAFNDHDTGQQIRSTLKHLVNHIVQLHNEGRLEKSIAQQQLRLGKALFALVNVDLGLMTARELEKESKIRAALAHYGNCAKQLEKLDPHLQLSNRLAYVLNKVEALRAEAASQEAQTDTAEQQEQEDEWQKFVDSDQGDWKIKQDYE